MAVGLVLGAALLVLLAVCLYVCCYRKYCRNIVAVEAALSGGKIHVVDQKGNIQKLPASQIP